MDNKKFIDFKSLLIAGTKICTQNKGNDFQNNAQFAINELFSNDQYDLSKMRDYREDPTFMNAIKFLDNVKSSAKNGVIETNTIIQVNDQHMQANIGGHNFDIDLTLSQDQIIKNVAEILCMSKYEQKSNNWLFQAFGQVAQQSKPKSYMFKLLEFNKIELVDNYSFLSQNSEMEQKLSQFLTYENQQEDATVDVEELKEMQTQMDEIKIEGTQQECHSFVFAILKFVKQKLQLINKKCQKNGLIDMDKYNRSKDESSSSMFDLFFKDTQQENKQYLNIIILLVRISEELQEKAKILKNTVDKVFSNQMAKRFIQNETIVLGFFYMFIYKDFVIREIIYKFSETVPQQGENSLNAIFLKKLKTPYDTFIMNDFAQWMNLMLSIEVFQSYSSIVTPNEFAPENSDGDAKYEVAESKNYQFFLKKYVKSFVKCQNSKPNFEIDYSESQDAFIYKKCDIPGSIFNDTKTFELGSGQTVKIDFEKPKLQSMELQQSCQQLIDQLAFYYNNFNHQIQFNEVAKSQELQKDYHQKIQSCMVKTKEFLNIFQSNNEQNVFNQEQEVLLRDLITQLRSYLSSCQMAPEPCLTTTDCDCEECQKILQECKCQNCLQKQSELLKQCKCNHHEQNISNIDEAIDCACCKQKFLVDNFMTLTPRGGNKARAALRKQITEEKIKAEAKTAKNRKKRQKKKKKKVSPDFCDLCKNTEGSDVESDSDDPDFEQSLQEFVQRLNQISQVPRKLIPNLSSEWIKRITKKSNKQVKTPQAQDLKNLISQALGTGAAEKREKQKSNSHE